MKRRGFIATTVGAASAAAIGAKASGKTVIEARFEPITVGPKPGQRRLTSFPDFFKDFTGHKLNDDQKTWFKDMCSGRHTFITRRQTGMSTFMYALALYDAHILGHKVVYCTYKRDWLRLREKALDYLPLDSMETGSSEWINFKNGGFLRSTSKDADRLRGYTVKKVYWNLDGYPNYDSLKDIETLQMVKTCCPSTTVVEHGTSDFLTMAQQLKRVFPEIKASDIVGAQPMFS